MPQWIDDERTLVRGKETVVKRGSWAFTLPEQHRIRLSEDAGLVSISTPSRGSTHHLREIIEDEDEVVVVLGSEVTRSAVGTGEEITEPTGYPFPTIDEEVARLTQRLIGAGGDPQRIQAWAAGEDYDSHLRFIRREIRAPERPPS